MAAPKGNKYAKGLESSGRPTDYRPTICNELINLMAEGLSLTAAAAELGYHRQRIYEWADTHQELADALKLAKGKRVLKLERDLLALKEGPAVTARIFALKNADPAEWREKVDHELTGRDGGPIETKDVSDSIRAKALAVFMAKTKGEKG